MSEDYNMHKELLESICSFQHDSTVYFRGNNKINPKMLYESNNCSTFADDLGEFRHIFNHNFEILHNTFWLKYLESMLCTFTELLC